jgi:putative drug exporter of the RND superfamily
MHVRDGTFAATAAKWCVRRRWLVLGAITAAAAIMILVFTSFVFGGDLITKQLGVGLAAAVLIDAIIIRSALVPALMLLLGDANWWFPAWLDRALLRIDVEADRIPRRRPEPAGRPY